MNLEHTLRRENLSRREFMQLAAAGAGYLVLPSVLSACSGSDSQRATVSGVQKDTIKNKRMQEGVVLASWWHDDYEKPWIHGTLNRLHDWGVESVSVLTTWYQDTQNSLEIKASASKTPSDTGIENVIAEAKALGMRTVLKPHVDVWDTSWRGTITHTADADWTAWFQSYTNFILHYAALAQRMDVEMLVIGTELDGTIHRPEWRQVIADLAAVYPGKISYGANHDRYQQVPFWDALDVVGVSVYFRKAEFAAKTQQMKDFASRHGKKLFILETGCQSRTGAGDTPWWTNGSYNEQEQADYYAVVLDTLFNACDGLFFWHVYHNLQRDPEDFTFIGKMAEQVVRNYYGR